jgi:methylenetetrahydrofolate reductase (NADPH)
MRGADFIQTQCIYNMPRFREFMKRAVDMGLDRESLHPGRGDPHEKRRHGQVHGQVRARHGCARIPDQALQGAGKGKPAEEGIKFAIEQIEEFKEMEGVAGVHLMAIEWEHKVPEIAERAGVLPRPKVD